MIGLYHTMRNKAQSVSDGTIITKNSFTYEKNNLSIFLVELPIQFNFFIL